MTCEEGDRHRWDDICSHCLDYGRDAATITEELEDWLTQTEDSVDHMADQITAMQALLEVRLARSASIVLRTNSLHNMAHPTRSRYRPSTARPGDCARLMALGKERHPSFVARA
jgi:hypothetical protein